jgi:hypothetical protein
MMCTRTEELAAARADRLPPSTSLYRQDAISTLYAELVRAQLSIICLAYDDRYAMCAYVQ